MTEYTQIWIDEMTQAPNVRVLQLHYVLGQAVRQMCPPPTRKARALSYVSTLAMVQMEKTRTPPPLRARRLKDGKIVHLDGRAVQAGDLKPNQVITFDV